MALHKQLFVGFGNGRFIIFDICRETEGGDDIEEAFNVYKSSKENLNDYEHVRWENIICTKQESTKSDQNYFQTLCFLYKFLTDDLRYQVTEINGEFF